MGFKSGRGLSDPLAMLGDPATHPKLLPHIPRNHSTALQQSNQPLGLLLTTPQDLRPPPPAAAPDRAPSS
jgi:hypothetical protein